jgi:hypothetical protein
MQRKRVVALTTDVGIGSALQEEFNRGNLLAADCFMKSRPDAAAARFVDEGRVCLQQGSE